MLVSPLPSSPRLLKPVNRTVVMEQKKKSLIADILQVFEKSLFLPRFSKISTIFRKIVTSAHCAWTVENFLGIGTLS